MTCCFVLALAFTIYSSHESAEAQFVAWMWVGFLAVVQPWLLAKAMEHRRGAQSGEGGCDTLLGVVSQPLWLVGAPS